MNCIKEHLTYDRVNVNGKIVESTLVHGLRNTRLITARNQDTGIPDPDSTSGRTGNWLGAMSYMAILDQIGTCYKHKAKAQGINLPTNSIEKALFYFSDLEDDSRKALYALRCAFLHDLSLLNLDDMRKGKPPRQKYVHHFLVYDHPTEGTIELPANEWQGVIADRTNDNGTKVNLEWFGNLVEDVYKKLLSLEEDNLLELLLEEAQFKARYFISYPAQ